MDITSLKAWEMKEKIHNREISSKEIIEAHIKRIEEVEPKINAFITLNKEEALKEASRIDEKIRNKEEVGVLAGLPIGVKDNIITKNLRTTCASKMLENFNPPYNATVIDKIKYNDGIIMGKTNMDEFAMGGSSETSYFGATKNPVDTSKVSGGSSGGSAAAVGAKEVPLALGTDTGGSVRQPASFCGVVGLKPSYGMVSRYGVIPMANTLDQVGVFGRDVKDAALMLSAVTGYDIKDSTSSKRSDSGIIIGDSNEEKNKNYLEGMTIAIPKEYIDLKPANMDIQAQFDNAVKVFENSGAKVEIVSVPHLKYALETYYIIMTCEVSSNMARFDGIRFGHRAENYDSLDELYINSRTEGLGDEVKRRIMTGTFALSADHSIDYYNKALKVRTLIKNDFDKVFANYDVMLSLVSPVLPYDFNSIVNDPIESYKADLYTVPVNLAGLCSMSIPVGTVDGLPVGLQITGDRFKEANIIRAGLGYERAVL
ncbi:Asp-tRNA(Asn)/Glu-tRNA(Gln) amidotransferase subunit GatA [Tissierella sp. Yu-01]|uniref:Asp-tRNA(Asn)/Glu-tRNA(Gln) amidotransferase subunit GatA n=1 Tax=Tissierella sp. Yu-01 TaxID=3035694 RepID=UPI00240D8BE4|nr:Asp-tRNA(Asn)/Glu-tRNA(Gln) amidotransferase subunit GatA [Tissierella sp. Yu-01]WFA08915.1 Asp-tRNA(Asn)/Glu-tRNA(Gln) amidotransferase subunit GatA [Tissierella sp. Yu-01]